MLCKPLISFDYAIPYLLKDKANHDIIEGFLSSLFSIAGYSAVKINNILEIQSADSEKFPGRSLADLIVENANGIKYIVAIDRAHSYFLHRACFRTSKLTVDNFKGRSGRDIDKIVHISLLYSPPDAMKEPVCYRKMVVRAVGHNEENTNDICTELDLRAPEYFSVAVPKFNDIIKNQLDEWLYLLKNSDVKDDFKSPCMSKIKERLSISSMSMEERQVYTDYLNRIAREEIGEAIYD